MERHERRRADAGYSRVSDAVEEIVDLRVWSGLHFRKADEDAERIGRRIAKYRATHYFERLHD